MSPRVKAYLTSINDPVAEKTDWTLAKPGGTSSQTQKFIVVSENRCELHQSSISKLTCWTMIIIGLCFWAVDLYFIINSKKFGLFLICGLSLITPGLLIGYFHSRIRVFDLESGLSWIEPRPNNSQEFTRRKDCLKLSELHALQIIPESISIPSSGSTAGTNDRSSGSRFTSYELNLVRKNGTRLNIMDHGYPADLREDAEKLRNLLKIPIWDIELFTHEENILD